MTRFSATIVCLALLACGLAGPTRADSPAIQEDASVAEIVKTLVSRHGGAKATERWRCGTIQFTTTAGVLPPGLGVVTVSESFDFPNSFKRSFRANSPQGEIDFTFIINEQGGWMTSPGKPLMEIPRSFADRPRHTFADFANVAHLPAQRSQLTLVRRLEIDGQPAVHLRLESEELGRVEFFVDVATGLLVGTSKVNHDPVTGLDATIATRLGKYQDIDGIPVPLAFSVTSNGKKLLAVEITSIQFNDALPASTFAKPE